MTKIDLSPAPVDLIGIRAGDKNALVMNFVQNGDPVDLTGLTIEAQARVTPVDTTPVLTAVITILNAEGGSFEIRWPGEDVRELLNGAVKWKGVWDLQVSNGVSDPETVMAGKFLVDEDVTR